MIISEFEYANHKFQLRSNSSQTRYFVTSTEFSDERVLTAFIGARGIVAHNDVQEAAQRILDNRERWLSSPLVDSETATTMMNLSPR